MNTYEFITACTTKTDKYWICNDYIRPVTITAESLTEAINQYRESINNQYNVTISNNALKNKQPMYHDTPAGAVQTGYVITGYMDLFTYDDRRRKWISQYIDLWITIKTIVNTIFPEEA